MNASLWLGSEESAYEYQRLIHSIIEKHGSLNVCLGDKDEDANPVQLDVLNNGLGVMTIRGSTISNTTNWSRFFGMVSYQDIRESLVDAADNYSVKAVLMDIHSPGGHANGVRALSRFISEIDKKVKPVFGFTQGDMASAALWYGTAGSKTIADEDARVGSVGALMVHMDYVDAMKKEGITPTVFRTSPFKALANPYEKLTDKAKTEIMKELMTLHNSFVNGLAENIGQSSEYVSSNIATGKMFSASEGLSLKLVNNVMAFDELVAKLGRALDNTASSPA